MPYNVLGVCQIMRLPATLPATACRRQRPLALLEDLQTPGPHNKAYLLARSVPILSGCREEWRSHAD
eukprot:6872696-Pyramimonas_sp.AAC.1